MTRWTLAWFHTGHGGAFYAVLFHQEVEGLCSVLHPQAFVSLHV